MKIVVENAIIWPLALESNQQDASQNVDKEFRNLIIEDEPPAKQKN